MSRKHQRKRPSGGEVVIPADALVATLQRRGKAIAEQMAHQMGPWQAAKRKWGKGATCCWCPRCAATVIVLPYGSNKTGSTSIQRSAPALTGDALFEVCDGIEFN